jgi:hypothetical protein
MSKEPQLTLRDGRVITPAEAMKLLAAALEYAKDRFEAALAAGGPEAQALFLRGLIESRNRPVDLLVTRELLAEFLRPPARPDGPAAAAERRLIDARVRSILDEVERGKGWAAGGTIRLAPGDPQPIAWRTGWRRFPEWDRREAGRLAEMINLRLIFEVKGLRETALFGRRGVEVEEFTGIMIALREAGLNDKAHDYTWLVLRKAWTDHRLRRDDVPRPR